MFANPISFNLMIKNNSNINNNKGGPKCPLIATVLLMGPGTVAVRGGASYVHVT